MACKVMIYFYQALQPFSTLLKSVTLIHYLTPSGKFQPGIERAHKFASKEMAEIMVKVHGGVVSQINKSE